MTQDIINILIYVGILAACGLIGIGGVWLKRRYNLKDEELNFVKTILMAVDYITGKTNIKIKNNITTIITYCIDAIDYVETYQLIENIADKKKAIKDKAFLICTQNGIEVDSSLVVIIDELVNYFIK